MKHTTALKHTTHHCPSVFWDLAFNLCLAVSSVFIFLLIFQTITQFEIRELKGGRNSAILTATIGATTGFLIPVLQKISESPTVLELTSCIVLSIATQVFHILSIKKLQPNLEFDIQHNDFVGLVFCSTSIICGALTSIFLMAV